MNVLRRLCSAQATKPTTDVEAAGAPVEPAFEAAENEKMDKHLQYQLSMSLTFTFVYQWVKENAADYILMGCMGVVCIVVHRLKPVAHRFFTVPTNMAEAMQSPFVYPHQKFIVPIWLGTFLPLFVPSVIFLMMQWRVRSFWDLNNAFIGLLYSLIVSAIFQVLLKVLIGGLRPHFLAVCNPKLPTDLGAGQGFKNVLWTREICQGDTAQINFAMSSFPSGHTTAAFAGFVYLSLYLNAKLKVWANYHAAFLKIVLLYLPILGAVLIACSLVVDYHHNWYDVLAGAVIGIVTAFSAYRAVWASVWDFRFNHIPLMRHIPFTYDATNPGYIAFGENTWTRKAGWGTLGQQVGGAPFDVNSGLGAEAPKTSTAVPDVSKVPQVSSNSAIPAVAGLPGITHGTKPNNPGLVGGTPLGAAPSITPKPSMPALQVPSPVSPESSALPDGTMLGLSGLTQGGVSPTGPSGSPNASGVAGHGAQGAQGTLIKRL